MVAPTGTEGLGKAGREERKVTGDQWSPLQVRSFLGEAGRVEDNVAGDRWSPLQIVTARSLQGVTKDKLFFTQQGDEHLRRLRQTFFFGQRHRLFA